MPEGAGVWHSASVAAERPLWFAKRYENRRGNGQAKAKDRMTRHLIAGGLAALMLVSCGPAGAPRSPERADLSREIVELNNKPGPPHGPEGACWASELTPTIIETVTEQVVASPERRDKDGNVTAPATFRTVTQQKIVQDRHEIWFRAPCPGDFTVAFVASLQRALKARGLFAQPVTGTMDAATAEAVRRYQADRGLDSKQLSLAAARELGLVATDFTQ